MSRAAKEYSFYYYYFIVSIHNHSLLNDTVHKMMIRNSNSPSDGQEEL